MTTSFNNFSSTVCSSPSPNSVPKFEKISRYVYPTRRNLARFPWFRQKTFVVVPSRAKEPTVLSVINTDYLVLGQANSTIIMTSWLFVPCFNLLITRYHLVPSHWPCVTLTWLVLKQYEQLADPPTLFLCKLCAFTLYMWTALWLTWCLDTNENPAIRRYGQPWIWCVYDGTTMCLYMLCYLHIFIIINHDLGCDAQQ